MPVITMRTIWEENRAVIIAAIEDGEQYTAGEIVTKTGLGRERVRAALKFARDHSQVTERFRSTGKYIQSLYSIRGAQ